MAKLTISSRIARQEARIKEREQIISNLERFGSKWRLVKEQETLRQQKDYLRKLKKALASEQAEVQDDGVRYEI